MDADGGLQKIAGLGGPRDFPANTDGGRPQAPRLPSPEAISPEALSVARALAFEALAADCALAESYARSASEAAWRADECTLEIHLRQLRACVVSAIQTFKTLNGPGENRGAS